MDVYEVLSDGFKLSTDKDLLDLELIYKVLSGTYWAENIPVEVIAKSVEHSLCFGLYHGDGQQLGFARMVTDRATFAYLADVFVIPGYRGKGLSKFMMKAILEHPDMKGLRRIMLATRDAHGLYKQFGFTAVPNPEIFMQIHRPGIYKNQIQND